MPYRLKKLLRRPLTIVLLGLTLGAIGYHSDPELWGLWTLCFAVATVLTVAASAPYYSIWTVVLVLVAFGRSPHLDTPSGLIMWLTFWLWVWSLYPWLYPSYVTWAERRDAKEEESRRRWEEKWHREKIHEEDRIEQQKVESLTAQKSAALAAELVQRPDIALATVVHAFASRILLEGCAGENVLQISLSPQSLYRVEGSKSLGQMEAARQKWGGKVPTDADNLWTWCPAQDKAYW